MAKRWWEQDGLDLEGMQTEDQEAEQTNGEEDTDKIETKTEIDLISGRIM